MERRGVWEEVAGSQREPLFAVILCTLTFVLQDVLSVGQHAGEGATEEQAQTGCPHKQEDHVVGEDKEHQERHQHADLSEQRWRRLAAGKSWAATETGKARSLSPDLESSWLAAGAVLGPVRHPVGYVGTAPA